MIIFNLFEAYNIVKCLASKVLPLVPELGRRPKGESEGVNVTRVDTSIWLSYF